VLPALLPEADAVRAARMILRENALAVYRLPEPQDIFT